MFSLPMMSFFHVCLHCMLWVCFFVYFFATLPFFLLHCFYDVVIVVVYLTPIQKLCHGQSINILTNKRYFIERSNTVWRYSVDFRLLKPSRGTFKKIQIFVSSSFQDFFNPKKGLKGAVEQVWSTEKFDFSSVHRAS